MSAEPQALFHDLQLAYNSSLVPLKVNVDASELLTVIHNGNMRFTNIISDCRHLLNQLHNPPVNHVYREENGVADRLAKEGCSMEYAMTPTVFASPPTFVLDKLQEDQSGATKIRNVKPTQAGQATATAAPSPIFAQRHVTPPYIADNGVTIVANSFLSSDPLTFHSNICTSNRCNSNHSSSSNVVPPEHHPLPNNNI